MKHAEGEEEEEEEEEEAREQQLREMAGAAQPAFEWVRA